MGIFGKLLEKKNCDICGGEIGLLGNRKLADGNLCKTCAAKLSPLFSDRRESTVEEIRAQLEYRAANEAELAGIRPTREFKGNQSVYLDENAQKFFVTSWKNWADHNPDLISLDQVTDAAYDIREHRTELREKNAEGKLVSYDPPRYRYAYEFAFTIRVDSPWFDEIRLELGHDWPDRRGSAEYRDLEDEAEELCAALLRRPVKRPAAGVLENFAAAVASAAATALQKSKTDLPEDSWRCTCGAVCTGKFCGNCGSKRPEPRPVCAACGWAPDDGAQAPKFCPNCGKPFGV